MADLSREKRTNIAALWSAYMGIHFTPKDVGLMETLREVGMEMDTPSMGQSTTSPLREALENNPNYGVDEDREEADT